MHNKDFSQRIDNFRDYVDQLNRLIEDLPSEHKTFITKAYEGFQVALEELQVAEEELLQQNEELLQTRLKVEWERQRYQDLFEFAPDGYLVTDAFGIIRESNQAVSSLLNIEPPWLIGKPLATFVNRKDLTLFRSRLNHLKQASPSPVDHTIREWEVSLQPRNAAPFEAALTVAPVFNPQAELIALRWMIRDITQQKQAQADLIRKSGQIKLLQEIAFAANTADSAEEALQFAVDNICAYTGWPIGHVYLRKSMHSDELMPTGIWHLENPGKYKEFRSITEHTSFSHTEGICRRVLVTGEPVWINDLAQEPGFLRGSEIEDLPLNTGLFCPIRAGKIIAGVIEFFSEETYAPDISLLEMMDHIGIQLGRVIERQQAQEAIIEREELLYTAVSAIPIVFFVIDHQGFIQLSLGKSLALTQKSIDPVGKNIFEIYQDIPQIPHSFHRALAGETFVVQVEAEELVFNAIYAPLLNEKGVISGVVGVAIDVTEQVQVAAALNKSEARFRTIFEQTDLGILLVDPRGRIAESNPALQKMLGYQAEELLQKSFSELVHPEDVEKALAQFAELVSGSSDNYQIEQRYIHKDAHIVWVRITISLFRRKDSGPHYAIAMIEDVTTEKQILSDLAEVERQLIDSVEIERLRLARELHDGPVQNLYGVSYMLSMLGDNIKDETGLGQLEAAQERVRQIVDNLRSIYGELRPPTLAPFGLEKAIRSHVDRLQLLHPDLDIQLKLMSDDQLLSERVRLTLFRIYQQISNNALRHAQAQHIHIRFSYNEKQLVLSIRDDGRGFEMPENWVELVRSGHFGLVGAAERAEAIGGQLKIKSKPGCGTVIRVVVPMTEQQQTGSRKRLLDFIAEK